MKSSTYYAQFEINAVINDNFTLFDKKYMKGVIKLTIYLKLQNVLKLKNE